MALIRGRVVDAGGNPVSGARVMLAGGPAPAPDVALLSGADGAFVLAVPSAGSWQLLAATDGARASAAVDVAGPAADVACTLTLQPG